VYDKMNQIQRNKQNTVQQFDDASNISFYEQDVGIPPRNSWRNSLRNSLTNNYLSKRLPGGSTAGYGASRKNNEPPIEVANYFGNSQPTPNNHDVQTFTTIRGFVNDMPCDDRGIPMRSQNKVISDSNLESNHLDTISEGLDITSNQKQRNVNKAVSWNLIQHPFE
jgi:hypothetical protein